MTQPARVIVLGAGPAGVGAAFQLARQKLAEVTVLERNATVGGNAGSFELGGLNVDYGSHRLHPSCDPAIMADVERLLGGDLLDRPRHGRIRLQGKWVRFPPTPLDLVRSLPPKFACGVAFDVLKKLGRFRKPRRPSESFASVLQDGLGATMCRDFYFPYARKIWGLEPEQLSAVQARRRVKAGSVGRLIRKVFAAVPGTKGQGGKRFYYPRGGFGQISRAYFNAASEHGAQFHLGATAEAINLSSGKVESVEYKTADGHRTLETDYLWSTIPVTVLINSIRPTPPADVVQASQQIRFRSMILIYLVIGKKQFSEFDAHYFPETEIAISRFSEPRNYSGVDQPIDRTVLCAELPCARTDSYWNMPDSQLGQLFVDTLAVLGIPITAPVQQIVTRRLPQAYPIYEHGYEAHFDRMDNWLAAIPNLLTFGRQGLFAHDNTHHALAMAYAAADCLAHTGEFDTKKWREYRRVFETHVVED